MKKLLFILFPLLSLPALAQNELPGDTITHRPPEKKQEVPFGKNRNEPLNPVNNAFIQDEQGTQTDVQDSITLHITPPAEYTPPLPWADRKKIHPMYDPFEMDFERYADFLLSPQVIMNTYGFYSTYPTMGSMMQAGVSLTYLSPNERWELSGGIYAANYSMPTPASLAGAQYAKEYVTRGTQWDLGLNASLAYRINDRIRIRMFGQYSGYGKSNSFHGYMTPMYPQSNYGIVMEVKVNSWLDVHGGVERVYDPTKMKWTTVPILHPVIHIGK